MIVEATMLVIGDHQQRRFPQLLVRPQRFVNAGDQTLLAPAFTSTDEELDLIVERMRETVRAVEREVKGELASDRSRIAVPSPGGDASG